MIFRADDFITLILSHDITPDMDHPDMDGGIRESWICFRKLNDVMVDFCPCNTDDVTRRVRTQESSP